MQHGTLQKRIISIANTVSPLANSIEKCHRLSKHFTVCMGDVIVKIVRQQLYQNLRLNLGGLALQWKQDHWCQFRVMAPVKYLPGTPAMKTLLKTVLGVEFIFQTVKSYKKLCQGKPKTENFKEFLHKAKRFLR